MGYINNSEELKVIEALAWQSIEINDFNNALIHYKKGNNLDKSNPIFWFGIGVCHMNLGNNEEANENFIVAHMLDKNNFPTIHNIAYTFLMLQEYKSAKRYFYKSLNIINDKDYSYYYLGLTYSKSNEPEQAINCYSKAININPKFKEAYFNRAIDYFNVGNFLNAKFDFTLALEHGVSINLVNEWLKKIKDIELKQNKII